EHRRLPIEAKDAAVDVRLLEQDTDVVDEVARGKVVGAVNDDVVGSTDAHGIGGGQAGFEEVEGGLGIDRLQALLGGVQLGAADGGGTGQDLRLQVGEIDGVEIDEPEPADARGRQVQPERRAEPAGADKQDARRLQPLLPFDADLRHDQVAAV